MAELQTEEDTDDKIQTNSNEDIDSKIADFMADIDEIVLGKRPSHSIDHPDKDDNGILNGATEREHSDRMSVWQKCFDETSQAVYYWNTDTNECSWDPPSTLSDECRMATRPIDSTLVNSTAEKKRSSMDQDTVTNGSVKKFKKPSLISAYTSSESESDDEEEDVEEEEEEEEKDDHDEDDIDELLNAVLDKDDSSSKVHTIDSYPSFEEDCRAAIARLIDLGDRTTPMLTLRIQLETRLEDVLAGHLSKSYAVSKLQEAVLLIETFEKSESPPPPIEPPTKPPLTSTDMALLLSQPPPPPPSSPPPPPLVSSTSNDEDNKALELFYAQLNCDGQIETISDPALTLQPMIPVEKSSTHHHHRKEKKSKPAKTLPTGLIEKWAQARQELRGDLDDVDET